MTTTPSPTTAGFVARYRQFLIFLPATLAISLGAMVAFNWVARNTSVFVLSNFVGPTAETLLHGKGLTVCSEGLGTLGNPICFHAARMPLPSSVIAFGAWLLGDSYLRVGLLKLLLMLVPVEVSAFLALQQVPDEGRRRWLAAALLLLPFFVTAFLADVVNLQVEEGYSYGLLTLATALAMFRPKGVTSPWRGLSFGLAAAGLYLAKSSMMPAVLVLSVAFLWPARRQVAVVAGTLAMVVLAAVGWAAWQHHAAGRYTLGTSIDGVNLHKGNDELFLAHYPPKSGETLDMYDPALNRGLRFPDEWSFNDYHQHAAVAFIRTHPGETVEGAWRKLEVVFFSLRKLGSKPSTGAMEVAETAGMVLFRLLFWGALLLSLRAVIVPGGDRERRHAALVFLMVTGAVALPYVVGFAYTRHISVLLYPSVLLLCATLLVPAPNRRLTEGLH